MEYTKSHGPLAPGHGVILLLPGWSCSLILQAAASLREGLASSLLNPSVSSESCRRLVLEPCHSSWPLHSQPPDHTVFLSFNLLKHDLRMGLLLIVR